MRKGRAEKREAGERIAPESVLRALIVISTRELALQVVNHLKEVEKGTNVHVVPTVGGMSTEKQERLLNTRPEIVVGTPGGCGNLYQLHSLSFFALDEADRMIESGHFRELRSIIDMLPMCREEDKYAYLYYILSVHGHGRTIVFCISIASLRHISAILIILNINFLALHSDMQQRACLKEKVEKSCLGAMLSWFWMMMIVKKHKQKKATSNQLNMLQQEPNTLLSRPLQPKTFSKRYLAGASVSPLLQHQFEELAMQKLGEASNFGEIKRKLVVIVQDCVQPLQALRSTNKEFHMRLFLFV